MIVIVTGSRDWPVERMIWTELDSLLAISKERQEPFLLKHGACKKGADAMARNWFTYQYYQGLVPWDAMKEYAAEWDGFGKAAGPLRNQAMVETGADRVLAFRLNHSSGTTDCMDRAARAGIPVSLVDLWIGQYVGEVA